MSASSPTWTRTQTRSLSDSDYNSRSYVHAIWWHVHRRLVSVAKHWTPWTLGTPKLHWSTCCCGQQDERVGTVGYCAYPQCARSHLHQCLVWYANATTVSVPSYDQAFASFPLTNRMMDNAFMSSLLA